MRDCRIPESERKGPPGEQPRHGGVAFVDVIRGSDLSLSYISDLQVAD